ncbi:MAG TPA: ATP-binding protein [Gaiellaceae bacterium]
MNPLKSVGAKLSLALAVVVAGALGAVYLSVVPSLRANLTNAKLRDLKRVAPALRADFVNDPLGIYDPDFMENASERANARAALIDLYSDTPPALQVLRDSRQGKSSTDIENDPVALAAAVALQRREGIVSRGDQRYAEVAEPVDSTGRVLLLSASLHDALGDVHQIQRRLLLAALFALGLSLALGYGGSWMFARRVRRLERAADRIAGGLFDEPIHDPSPDELGQLARGFDRMRLRLAQLDHARNEFIANASHELRTPLFSLGGFLELMGDEELDEETRREFLDTMREQVDRLTRLATDLLDLSRLDAGRLRVERSTFDLAEVAETLAEEFRALASGGGRHVELVGNGEVLAVGDDERALRIGRALVENALRHTPPGTSVSVRADRNGGSSVLEVADDGPGVPAEHADQVFERFYRVEGGALASGSGLGLAIARELAELMGGRVELESVPGRTTFRLVLPTAAEEFSRENVAAGVG